MSFLVMNFCNEKVIWKKKKKKKNIIEGMLIQKEEDIYELCNCIFWIRNWVVIYLTLPN